MPTPQAYNRLHAQYEELRFAAIRVCVSEHPAPELSRLWDLVGDFTDADLIEAKRQAE